MMATKTKALPGTSSSPTSRHHRYPSRVGGLSERAAESTAESAERNDWLASLRTIARDLRNCLSYPFVLRQPRFTHRYQTAPTTTAPRPPIKAAVLNYGIATL